MASKSSFHLPNSLRMGLLIAALVGLLIAALAWFQIEREHRNDLEEMDRRAYVLAHQMVYPAQVALQLPDSEAATALGSMLEGYRRLIGLAVYRADGRVVAAGKGVADFTSDLQPMVLLALAGIERHRRNPTHGRRPHPYSGLGDPRAGWPAAGRAGGAPRSGGSG